MPIATTTEHFKKNHSEATNESNGKTYLFQTFEDFIASKLEPTEQIVCRIPRYKLHFFPNAFRECVLKTLNTNNTLLKKRGGTFK